MDKGPWKAMRGVDRKWNVYSDDFTHDVALAINGDFVDEDARKRYCEWLATTLNRASSQAANTWPLCPNCKQPVYFAHSCGGTVTCATDQPGESR